MTLKVTGNQYGRLSLRWQLASSCRSYEVHCEVIWSNLIYYTQLSWPCPDIY